MFLLDAWTIHRESVSSFTEDSEAYIVTKENFIRIRGFSILSDDIVDKGKVYIACALENCNGTLHFQNGKQVEVKGHNFFFNGENKTRTSTRTIDLQTQGDNSDKS